MMIVEGLGPNNEQVLDSQAAICSWTIWHSDQRELRTSRQRCHSLANPALQYTPKREASSPKAISGQPTRVKIPKGRRKERREEKPQTTFILLPAKHPPRNDAKSHDDHKLLRQQSISISFPEAETTEPRPDHGMRSKQPLSRPRKSKTGEFHQSSAIASRLRAPRSVLGDLGVVKSWRPLEAQRCSALQS